MKAVVCTRFGPAEALELREVEKPTPKDNEVLVKIHATTVTTGDVALRRMSFLLMLLVRLMTGLQRKKIQGHELAGEVEAVGAGVTRFKPGDQVFGTTSLLTVGAHAEYVCLPADWVLATKPANVTYEEAAAVPVGGMTTLYFLRKANIQNGHKALVYGASGSVGTYAVQIARHLGAEVTGVCSTANVELVKSLGAGTVIDYTQEDFTERGEQYDVIFDAVGKTSQKACAQALAPGGACVTVQGGLAKESIEELEYLREAVEAGAVKPVIDRRFALEQIVEAHRYVETGHKKGNVVIPIIPQAGG